MKDFNAEYNEQTDGYQQASPGKYPAHVTGFQVFTTGSGSKVFNIEFTLAEECKDMQINKMTRNKDNNYESIEGEMINAGFMAGKKYFTTGLWLTPNLPSDQRWKNRSYTEFCKNIGIEFEKGENGSIKLSEIEESDIIGMPGLAHIDVNKYKDKKTGEEKASLKVVNVFPWNDGERKEPPKDTDVPF